MSDKYKAVNIPITDPIHQTWPFAVKDCEKNIYVVLTRGATNARHFAKELNDNGFIEDPE